MAPHSPFQVTHSSILLFLIYITSLTCALDVSIPLGATSDVPKISPSFISLSIEFDRWTEWAGNVSRNEFFYNTLDNLKQITGKPPSIRIGGNSLDATTFRADVQVWISRNTIQKYNIYPYDSSCKKLSLNLPRQLHIQRHMPSPLATHTMAQCNSFLPVSYLEIQRKLITLSLYLLPRYSCHFGSESRFK
jgi:hypothetical protein